jgi:hypothetical protein
MNARPNRIYQYVRNLRGIKGYLEAPTPSEDDDEVGTLLGYWAYSYVKAHGYTSNSIRHIQHAFEEFNTSEEFTDYLADMGMPQAEAEWLWKLILSNFQN